MTNYAQTNLELMGALKQLGFPREGIQLVHDAYRLTAHLSSGQFRPSGKSFLSHLIGTAAVLAAHGATPEMTAAGLLHAAYRHGDFGTVRSGPTTHNRTVVREVVGERVERLVYDYEMLSWNRTTIDRLHTSNLTPTEETLAFMRIANALEDHLDGGVEFTPNFIGRQRSASLRGPILVDIAHKIRKSELASELAGEYDRLLAADPDDLQALRTGFEDTRVVLPASARPKIWIMVLRVPGHLLRRLRDAIREIPRWLVRRARAAIRTIRRRRSGE